MAVRYDQKKKDEVVAFITDYNKKNGRGGQSAAAKKFGITAITISNWLKKAGLKPTKKKAASKKRAGRPRGSSSAPASGGSKSGVLGKMMKIQTQIESLQADYDALKKQL